MLTLIVEKHDLEKNLEEFIVKDGDVFMVELKFGEKWPRDAQNEKVERDWRDFEVGDRVDVFYVRFVCCNSFASTMSGKLAESSESLKTS